MRACCVTAHLSPVLVQLLPEATPRRVFEKDVELQVPLLCAQVPDYIGMGKTSEQINFVLNGADLGVRVRRELHLVNTTCERGVH